MDTETNPLPALDRSHWGQTRDALHAYARVIGGLRAALAPRQKHGWHLSLAVHTRGLTTGPMHTPTGAMEARLDFVDGHAAVLDSRGYAERWYLTNLPAAKLARLMTSHARDWGLTIELDDAAYGESALAEASRSDCQDLFTALLWADSVLEAFKARQREETSPVQLRPHHFDLAVLWLNGRRVPDIDPDDEERADQQMNFGFSLGTGSERPYFYVTCYPQPDGFPGVALPGFARRNSEGWQGVRVDYDALRALSAPGDDVQNLMQVLRAHGAALLDG